MKATLQFLGQVFRHAGINARSGKYALFEARIRQAAAAPGLMAFCEQIMTLMQTQAMHEDLLPAVIREASERGNSILWWIRENHRLASMLAHLSYRDPEAFDASLDALEIEAPPSPDEIAYQAPAPDIRIALKLLSPLAHGSDEKCGNATLMRRRPIGPSAVEIPYYAGNAFRGQMRDLLADHFLETLGLTPDHQRPPVALWFFHLLYAGGGLGAAAPTPARKAAGERANAVSLDDRALLRDMVPPLSLFGCAIGVSLLSGKFDALDFLPECAETGHDAPRANDLLMWEYGVRRDDLDAEHEDNQSMIAAFELLKPGVTLHGGINYRPNIREVEVTCLWAGLALMQEHGRIGAQTRRGWGLVEMEVEGVPVADLSVTPYTEWLTERRDELVAYLVGLGAVDGGDWVAGRASRGGRARGAGAGLLRHRATYDAVCPAPRGVLQDFREPGHPCRAT